MAQICRMCNDRPADLLVTIVENGDSTYMCLPCSPMWLAACFEVAELPEWVPVPIADLAEAAPQVADDHAWEESAKPAKAARKRGPAKAKQADPEPAQEAPAADVDG